MLETSYTTSRPEIASVPVLHVKDLPPMYGSHESLLRQNQVADQEHLARVQNDVQLKAMSRDGMLVEISESQGLHIDPRLQAARRYCRPWTERFLSDISRAYYHRFHEALQLNSAVRTVQFQKHLLLVNANAAPAEGDTRSPHLTGEAVDITKKGLSSFQIAWLRTYLSPLQASGRLDVEEEFQQACFHISVYRSYMPPAHVAPPKAAPKPRSRHRRSETLLAVQIH
jgi:hypothetical protein